MIECVASAPDVLLWMWQKRVIMEDKVVVTAVGETSCRSGGVANGDAGGTITKCANGSAVEQGV